MIKLHGRLKSNNVHGFDLFHLVGDRASRSLWKYWTMTVAFPTAHGDLVYQINNDYIWKGRDFRGRD